MAFQSAENNQSKVVYLVSSDDSAASGRRRCRHHGRAGPASPGRRRRLVHAVEHRVVDAVHRDHRGSARVAQDPPPAAAGHLLLHVVRVLLVVHVVVVMVGRHRVPRGGARGVAAVHRGGRRRRAGLATGVAPAAAAGVDRVVRVATDAGGTVPHLLGLVEDLCKEGRNESLRDSRDLSNSLTRALHPEQEEHGDDGEEGADGVRDDELERVVVGDEQDVEDGGGGQVAGEEAARVRQDRPGVDHVQAEEGDRPDAVEDLKENA